MDLSLVKAYCRIDGDDDDEILCNFIDASLGEISHFCNRKFFETEQNFDTEIISGSLKDIDKKNAIIIERLNKNLQKKIELARLKLIVDWFEYRGNAVELNLSTAPNGIKELLQPFFIYKIVAD